MTVEQSLAPVPAPAAPPGAARRALSPSRAADFKTCPLLYRFRSIDRLPERPTPEQVRGTLVHAVLERLFDAPAPQRTPRLATTLVEPQWHRLTAERTELAGLFEGDAERELLASTGDLLRGYFAVEDPRRLDPAERESLVQVEIDGSLLLRGYVDRLDVSPDGDLRVVDYKTGGAPRGVVPRVLRLLYLKDAEACDFTPDADDLARFERTLLALWRAIERAAAERTFQPKPSRLCDWCSHQALCPAFGGTPPAYPDVAGR